MSPLVTPTINMNGNTAADLIAKLRGVLDAIHALQNAMTDASDLVHGRNFQYPTGEHARREASDAWCERYLLIEAFDKEVLALAIAIQKQRHRK